MSTVAVLQELGFTEYEARAYSTLVAEGELNGYELAKKTGIPRANIYAVAARLVERKAILPAEHGRGRRYVALPPDQLLRSLRADHQRVLERAHSAFERQENPTEAVAVLNLRGAELMAHAQVLVDSSQHTLLLALHAPAAGMLSHALQMARERGVQLWTLCLQGCQIPCGGCLGQVYRNAIHQGAGPDRLLVVADARSAVVGQVHKGQQPAEQDHGFMTRQPVVVGLATDYIRQQLVIAGLTEALGPRLESVFQTPELRVLDSLYPDGGLPANLSGLSARTSSECPACDPVSRSSS